jgi:pimeloyl-ACP methyl ester carboxylesterase
MWETEPHFTAEQLRGITVPTWIVDADHDEAIKRENAEFMASEIPNAGLLLQVESECGAVAVGRTYLLPPLSSGGASLVRPWLRFHTPLIEPDMQISRIRLSDKTSRLHPRRAATKLC